MNNILSPEQVEQYERDGILFPIPVLTVAELGKFRSKLQEMEQYVGGSLSPQQVTQPCLHFRWAYDLATYPKILEAVEDIIGPNILVHSSTLFCKYPHHPEFVSWHQDGHYWKVDAPRLTSAWIALDDSTIENGCLRVIKGSHTQRLPHYELKSKDNLLATGSHVAIDFNQMEIVDVILKAGEMSLHHVNSVHGSEPNESDMTRMGFAIRFVAPEVKQTRKHHAVILARGSDDYHRFDILDKEPPDDMERSFAAVASFRKQFVITTADNP